jgi:UDP-2-acetamido-3-amino-2,3-dideoxy-glucuronate N-acetyltransferase
MRRSIKSLMAYKIHPSSFVDDGASIGDGTCIWHFCHVLTGSEVGNDCSIGQNVVIGPNAKVGNRCKIQNNVSIYEGVELGDFVFCGPSLVFTNVLNPRCEYPQRGSDHYKKTIVKHGASLGANATILCGITIGYFAFVGAGSVVTRDVPNFALMIGNPARIAGWICRCGLKLYFSGETAACARCNRQYLKSGTTVVRETSAELESIAVK